MYAAVVIGVVAIIVASFFLYKKLYGKPVPYGGPFVNMLHYRKNISAIWKIIADYKAHFVTLSSPFGYQVIVTHPDAMRDVVNNEDMFPKKELGKVKELKSLAKHSVIFTNKTKWSNQRSEMSPSFHYSSVKSYIPTMVKKSHQLLNMFPEESGFDVRPLLSNFTLDVLGLCVLGRDFNILDNQDDEYYVAYKTMMTLGSKISLNPLRNIITKIPFIPIVNRLDKANAKLLVMTDDIINSRIAGKHDNEQLIDVMVASHNMSPEELRSNIFLFFLAGHETTASSLSWALYLIAKHADVQKKLRDEVDRVLKGRVADSDDFKDLVYLDMFIKEVLRYGSPVAAVATREAAQDVTLYGQFIPKNTLVGLGIHAIHHNPDFWEEPEVFNPERFSPDNTKKVHPFAYLPFSLGRHNCIGNNFSLVEQKLFLCLLLQRFELVLSDPSQEFKLDGAINLSHVPATVDIVAKQRAAFHA